jgi:hypothetical protein
MRKYVLALDPKGGDSTLEKLERVGFAKSGWPLSKQARKAMEEGEQGRFIITNRISEMKDYKPLSDMFREVIKDAFAQRNWTIYVDELQVAADRRIMNLGAPIELTLIAARDRKVSMVTSFQRPANVPRSASEMSTWFMLQYTRDLDTVDRLAQMAGRPNGEIRGLVKGLPEYCTLVFSRNPREPVIVTKAKKV